MEKLYTVQETANIFGVSKQTVHNWKAKGKIKTTATPGGELRIRESELQRILKSGENTKRKNNLLKEEK